MNLHNEKNPAEIEGGWRGLLELQRQFHLRPLTGSRKWHIERREQILGEGFREVIAAKLADTFYSKEIKERMRRHIGVVANPGADITRSLACVYDQHPRRRFRDGSDEENRALLRINEATQWHLKAKEINQRAWFCGPVLEVPMASGEVFRREFISGSRVDLVVAEDDPLGHPIASAFPWMHKGKRVIYVIDAEAYRVFDVQGSDEPIDIWDHGVVDEEKSPLFPGTLHRYDCPTDVSDYWNLYRNARLVDGTIECGTIYTALSWIRKSQNRKLIALIGDLEQLSTGVIDPERPIEWDMREEEALGRIEAINLDTPVTEFREHIQFIYRTLAEGKGISSGSISAQPDDGASVAQVRLQHDQKVKLRNDQIPYALMAEERSQFNLAAVARAAKHKLADGLPDPAEFKERLQIEFPALVRVEDPKARQDELDWMLKRGMTTDAHIYQMRHPELTLEESQEQVKKNLELQAELNELKASRNSDPAAEMQDENERTGALRSDPAQDPEPENDEQP